MQAALRSSTSCPSRCSKASRTRPVTVSIRAAFSSKSDAAERRKDEQFRMQQELLAERRAKREQIMTSMGRKAAGMKPEKDGDAPSRSAAPKAQLKAPSKKPEPVVVEEDEEEEPAKPANPLAGLFNMFGKK